MDARNTGLALVMMAVVLLTATQLMIKSRLAVHGLMPLSPSELFSYLLALLQDWKFLIALVTLVVAAFCWYSAVSRLPLSIVFPFSALSYPLIFVCAPIFLRESFSWQGLVGNGLIVAGVMLIASNSQA